MLKNQKGITLVSLVITIVVLIILAAAAVTIAVTGQDSIFTEGNTAVKKWNNQVDEESNIIQNAITDIEKYKSTEQ